MKTKFAIIGIFVVFISWSSFAQADTLWLDSYWNRTTKDKAIYYRPTPQKKGNAYWLIDYYINGKKQMEGLSYFKELDAEKFEGLVKYFFENGVLFQEVNYKNGKIEGIRKIYYPSGVLKNERSYINDKAHGTFTGYYETGEVEEIGKYVDGEKNGNWKLFYKNGKIKEKGQYKQGKKIGIWKTFYKNEFR